MSWINKSANTGRKLKDMFNLSGVDVFIKDRTPDNVDDEFVFNYVNARIPFHLTTGIDVIYVGQFPEMKERDINAFYEDGAIYVTNDQEEEMDMVDDIIHELAHAVEVNNQEILYGSGKLQREFKAKRRNLYYLIQDMYEIPDSFLSDIVANIFVSGYGATSVSEYFARGFEEYFIGDKDSLREMSPVLYKIIDKLVHMEDE